MAINTITTIQTMTNNIVDIHSHIIFGVDDGAQTLQDSTKSLELIQQFGIKKVICTPHIRYGNSEHIKKIKENYLILRDIAKQKGIDLYLGTEILMTSETTKLLLEKRLRSLAGKKYVLVEFKRNEDMEIDKIISLLEDLMDVGYRPILAHPELYNNYRNIKYMKKLKEKGVILQLDANSILKRETDSKIYRFSKKLLKEKLIDIVASDNHSNNRRNYATYIKAYHYMYKKYGKDYTELLFSINPSEILK